MSEPFRIAAILGLDCGRKVYELLAARSDIELIAVFAKENAATQNIAGYLDFSAFVPKDIFQPYAKLSDIGGQVTELGELDAVFALGVSEIVKEPILSAGRRGCFGVHAAKLPDRPGCSPIIWAILDGLEETAVTLFRMDDKIDNGSIFDMEPVPIGQDETAGDIREKCDDGIVTMLERSLTDVLSGKNMGRPQGNGPSAYTRKRGVKDGEINLSGSASSILRKVNALSSPYPGAHIYAGDGQPIIIEKARMGGKELTYKEPISMKKILCIVAHPDDEALGVGGTLIRHARFGDQVEIIILSDGEGAKSEHSTKDPERTDKASAWAKTTGCILRAHFDFPDQQLDTVPLIKIVKLLEKEIEEFNPDIIYTHHPGDMNSDHQITAQCVLAAKRPMHSKGQLPDVFAFETPSSTDQAPNVLPFIFAPNHYVVLDTLLKDKMSALDIYSNELGPPPHPRSEESIRALATKRGAECGALAAEAFVILRSVWTR
jgi:N-acetylglucosamine malate deacetylase 1